jgi:hypothetical protein
MNSDIIEYNDAQSENEKVICDALAKEIQIAFPDDVSKIWHGAPVWFIKGNPIVGYWVRNDHVQLLFWSGQSFDEPRLVKQGKFKAAEAIYSAIEQIDSDVLQRWLKKSRDIQWDYKNIVKRRGELIRLK